MCLCEDCEVGAVVLLLEVAGSWLLQSSWLRQFEAKRREGVRNVCGEKGMIFSRFLFLKTQKLQNRTSQSQLLFVLLS